MQGDGNLVVYNRHAAVRASNTAGLGAGSATMGMDGNLVVTINGRTAWQSGTSGNPGAFLRVQDDGAASIISAKGVLTSTR